MPQVAANRKDGRQQKKDDKDLIMDSRKVDTNKGKKDGKGQSTLKKGIKDKRNGLDLKKEPNSGTKNADPKEGDMLNVQTN